MSGPDYLDYHSPCQTFSLAFSSTSGTSGSAKASASRSALAPFPVDLKLAVASYSETSSENNITVLGLNPSLAHDPDSYSFSSSSSDFVPLAQHATQYPVTKVDFAPASLAARLQSTAGGGDSTREMVATTSDCLRLWDLSGDPRRSHTLSQRSKLSNAKSEHTAPLTSFCWSTIDPSSIVTSSIDTTCTIWDINTNQAVTQLIAHDREVFDVAFSPASRDIFASVGADGSARSFDLRHLDHSTILYESSSASGATGGSSTGPSTSSSGTASNANGTRPRGSPLLRVAYNPTDANSLAVIHANSGQITILDVRSPGLAVAELKGHSSSVNGIAWCGGEQENAMLASVGDDAQVYMWDLNRPSESSRQTLPRTVGLPNAACSLQAEANSVVWGGGRGYLAVGMGRTVRCLRV